MANRNIEKIFAEQCNSCSNYPGAKEPFNELRDIDVSRLTEKIVSNLSEKTGLKDDCILCYVLREFFKVLPEERIKRLAEISKQN